MEINSLQRTIYRKNVGQTLQSADISGYGHLFSFIGLMSSFEEESLIIICEMLLKHPIIFQPKRLGLLHPKLRTLQILGLQSE